jgi:hypothetical protein
MELAVYRTQPAEAGRCCGLKNERKHMFLTPTSLIYSFSRSLSLRCKQCPLTWTGSTRGRITLADFAGVSVPLREGDGRPRSASPIGRSIKRRRQGVNKKPCLIDFMCKASQTRINQEASPPQILVVLNWSRDLADFIWLVRIECGSSVYSASLDGRGIHFPPASRGFKPLL